MHADPRELSRAISNLLLNAIQHTPPGSPITVAASVVDGRASVTVIDTGGGIDEDDLHRVFDPGWRGESPAPADPHPRHSAIRCDPAAQASASRSSAASPSRTRARSPCATSPAAAASI